MNNTEPEPHSTREEPGLFRSIRDTGITRSRERVFAGVMGGLAARWGMGAGVLRVLAVVVALFTMPVFVMAYVLGWMLLPDSSGRIVLESDEFNAPHRSQESS